MTCIKHGRELGIDAHGIIRGQSRSVMKGE